MHNSTSSLRLVWEKNKKLLEIVASTKDMLRLLVNLDRSPDRLKTFQLMFAEKCPGLSFTRIPAVDGKTLTSEEIQSLLPSRNSGLKVDFRGELIDTEIGCFLSHRRCWQALLDSSEQWALIMEDDVELSSKAEIYLHDESWIPEDVSIVQLHTTHTKIRSRKIDKPIRGERKLISQYWPPPMSTLSYLINREAATLALELSEKLPAPVDVFLFLPYSTFRQSFETWTMSPSIVTSRSNLESTIGGDGRRKKRQKSQLLRFHPVRIWRKLKRELARWLLSRGDFNYFE